MGVSKVGNDMDGIDSRDILGVGADVGVNVGVDDVLKGVGDALDGDETTYVALTPLIRRLLNIDRVRTVSSGFYSKSRRVVSGIGVDDNGYEGGGIGTEMGTGSRIGEVDESVTRALEGSDEENDEEIEDDEEIGDEDENDFSEDIMSNSNRSDVMRSSDEVGEVDGREDGDDEKSQSELLTSLLRSSIHEKLVNDQYQKKNKTFQILKHQVVDDGRSSNYDTFDTEDKSVEAISVEYDKKQLIDDERDGENGEAGDISKQIEGDSQDVDALTVKGVNINENQGITSQGRDLLSKSRDLVSQDKDLVCHDRDLVSQDKD